MSDDAAAITYLHQVFAAQKAAFLKDQYPSVAARQADLHKLAGMMMNNRENIRQALKSDFAVHDSGFADVIETLGPSGRAVWVATQVEKWMADEDKELDAQVYGSATAKLHWEPKGVIGALSPFNFPFELSIGPLCEQLASGNRIIIKPSELSPASSKLIKEMINATFPADKIEVVLGGVELATEFSTLKWDHLMYTGSPAVGKLVMKAASAKLVPVTLELGGKCPAIICKDGLNETNIQSIMGSKIMKSGQMCVSVDTVYLHTSQLEEFIQGTKDYMKKIGPYSTSDACCGIITERHLDRLVRLYDEAKASGAKVVDLEDGQVVNRKTRQMGISLVINPGKDCAVYKEEVFGPLINVQTYDDIKSCVAEINAGERPLGLYVYSDENETDIAYVLENTTSGGVSVNTAVLQAAIPSLPFGGIGNSGMGVHHGVEGFREFSNPKGVVRKGKAPDMLAAFYPPYSSALGLADHVFAQAASALAPAAA
ncbi:hypothetical protein P7C70_g1131, partial [Phenoliferia sp. Uapishka_3]